MKVVLASRNKGKLKEFDRLLSPHGFTISSQADHDVPSAPETGATFVENALLKARAVALATGYPAIADDSGLVVPLLDGAPGIFSARYAGEQANDAANNTRLIEALAQRGSSAPAAFFFCAMVYLGHASDPTPLIATARWHGTIVAEPQGENGFGYDPHFMVAGENCTSAQLLPERKDLLSHRGQATRALLAQLLEQQFEQQVEQQNPLQTG